MRAQVPTAVADYFHRTGIGGWDFATGRPVVAVPHPVIHATFVPGRGWRTYPVRKRISRSWAVRHLRPEGVTDVALAAGGRVADFRIQELTRP
jgi:hypothetical protein